jgi:hypothetical protein
MLAPTKWTEPVESVANGHTKRCFRRAAESDTPAACGRVPGRCWIYQDGSS